MGLQKFIATTIHEYLKEQQVLNEGQYHPENIKAYYEALCKAEGVKPLPVKFESVGYGGAKHLIIV